MKHLALLLVSCAALAVIFASDGYEDYDDAPNCKKVCAKNLDPVCAKDAYGTNRTYPNRCFIGYLNCKEETRFHFVSKGECPDDPIFLEGDDVSQDFNASD